MRLLGIFGKVRNIKLGRMSGLELLIIWEENPDSVHCFFDIRQGYRFIIRIRYEKMTSGTSIRNNIIGLVQDTGA